MHLWISEAFIILRIIGRQPFMRMKRSGIRMSAWRIALLILILELNNAKNRVENIRVTEYNST